MKAMPVLEFVHGTLSSNELARDWRCISQHFRCIIYIYVLSLNLENIFQFQMKLDDGKASIFATWIRKYL